MPFVDLFFADLKIPDPEKHREFTGCDNRLIIENIRTLSLLHNNVILRVPMIPTVNDTEKDLDGFANVIQTFGAGIRGVELLRYNHLAESKYTIAGEKYEKYAESSQSDEEILRIKTVLSKKINVPCYLI